MQDDSRKRNGVAEGGHIVMAESSTSITASPRIANDSIIVDVGIGFENSIIGGFICNQR